MEPETLQTHIAYTAGQAKTPLTLAGARAVVEILRVSGLVKETDGKIVATNGQTEISPTGRILPEVTEGGADAVPTAENSGPTSHGPFWRQPHVTIQVQIQCAASEIEEIGPKIRSLLEEISQAYNGKIVEPETTDE